MLPLTVGLDENHVVASFDDRARVKRKGGAYSAIIWKLPEWTIVAATFEFTSYRTMNEAEYRGLLLSFDSLADQTRRRVIICGDSNSVTCQMQDEIDCKAPRLQFAKT